MTQRKNATLIAIMLAAAAAFGSVHAAGNKHGGATPVHKKAQMDMNKDMMNKDMMNKDMMNKDMMNKDMMNKGMQEKLTR